MLYHFVRHTWGTSKSMTKDEYFKLCTALVQEQVYTWVIASSFVLLMDGPQIMADDVVQYSYNRIGLYGVVLRHA